MPNKDAAPIQSAELAALRRLAEAATQGAWTHQRFGAIVAGPVKQYSNGAGQEQIAMTTGTPWMRENEHMCNADFIAGANPAAILRLLDALAAVQTTPAQPSKAQLIAQLEDYDEKWTPAEQREFAVFLQRFPNESSKGIQSLGSAWKHGKASSTPAQPIADVSAPTDERAAFEEWARTTGLMAESFGVLSVSNHCGTAWKAWQAARSAAPVSGPSDAMTDLMPKRAAFIKFCEKRGLDTSVDKDAWGAQIFKHSHIQAMWEGWFNAPSAAPVSEQAASIDTPEFGQFMLKAFHGRVPYAKVVEYIMKWADSRRSGQAAQEPAVSAVPESACADEHCLKVMCLVEDYMAAVDWHGSQNGEKCDAAIEAIGQYLRKIAPPAAPTAQPLTDAVRLDFIIAEECRVESLTLKSGTRYRLDWPQIDESQAEWFAAPREAIDAARLAGNAGAETDRG